jgi:TRAP-type mannitol/chloroaromatic compound transport system substrate-binding protein
MGQKRLWFVLVLSVVVASFLATPVMAAGPIKWKIQTYWSPVEETYKAFAEACKRVKVLTNGRMEITPYPGGAIVPDFQALDAVQNNIIQGMYTWAGYWAGKEPAFAPLTDFGGAYREIWQMSGFMYYKGGLDMLNELYAPYGLYTLAVASWGVENFVSKYPIRRIEDFKGHKFRAPHGLTADLLAHLGAGVVVLPGTEVYSALDKGVIDGMDWATVSMNYRMGFHEIAKYYIDPGIHSLGVNDLTVSKKEWDKLPKDIQEILKVNFRALGPEVEERVYIDCVKARNECKKLGVTVITWTPEERARLMKEFDFIWAEWAKKSPMAAKVVDAHKKWVKELGYIQ